MIVSLSTPQMLGSLYGHYFFSCIIVPDLGALSSPWALPPPHNKIHLQDILLANEHFSFGKRYIKNYFEKAPTNIGTNQVFVIIANSSSVVITSPVPLNVLVFQPLVALWKNVDLISSCSSPYSVSLCLVAAFLCINELDSCLKSRFRFIQNSRLFASLQQQ